VPGPTFQVHGDLTIKGITRPVVLDATFNGSGVNPWGQTVASWSATTEIDREAWGMNFNAALEAGGVLVGTNVKVAIEIEAARQS
jgi:polyisoprenoid-binding protein YceI